MPFASYTELYRTSFGSSGNARVPSSLTIYECVSPLRHIVEFGVFFFFQMFLLLYCFQYEILRKISAFVHISYYIITFLQYATGENIFKRLRIFFSYTLYYLFIP